MKRKCFPRGILPKIPVLFILICIFICNFSSCGMSQSVPEQETPEPVQSAEPEEPAEPETEEELRQAIALLGDEGEELSRKREYYERIQAMDLFGEEDYAALAQVYAGMGEWKLQRSMLSKALRLYPSREYADQLGAVVVQGDPGDTELAAFAQEIMTALEQRDMAVLGGLADREEWVRLLQDGMPGILCRTRYCEGENVLQIAAEDGCAEITWQGSENRFYYYKKDGTGMLLGETSLTESGYNGDVTVDYSDPEGNIIRSYRGTLADGICVDQITVVVQGTEYTGKLNSDGTTAEEQYQKVADAGGVVYAYTADGRSYLYQEEAAPETFRMDAAYLGFPEYEEWR